MTNPLEQAKALGLTEQVVCEEYAAARLAFKSGKLLLCDTLQGYGIPVRDVRLREPWEMEKNLLNQTNIKVCTLEGWSVPERVYYVERKVNTK